MVMLFPYDLCIPCFYEKEDLAFWFGEVSNGIVIGSFGKEVTKCIRLQPIRNEFVFVTLVY